MISQGSSVSYCLKIFHAFPKCAGLLILTCASLVFAEIKNQTSPEVSHEMCSLPSVGMWVDLVFSHLSQSVQSVLKLRASTLKKKKNTWTSPMHAGGVPSHCLFGRHNLSAIPSTWKPSVQVSFLRDPTVCPPEPYEPYGGSVRDGQVKAAEVINRKISIMYSVCTAFCTRLVESW